MNKTENLTFILKKLSQNKDISGIRLISQQNNSIDLADALTKLSINESFFCIRSLQNNSVGEIFSHLETKQQLQIVENFTKKELKRIFEEIFNDDLVNILENMPANLIRKILLSVPKERRYQLNKILNYLDNTAGSIMTTEFIFFYEDKTIKAAINHIKELGKDRIKSYTNLYVLSRNHSLIGMIELSDLIFSQPNKKIKNLVQNTTIFINDKEDQEKAANIMKKYEISTLPVINSKNEMVGIITIDDVLDVVEEEATEDIHKIAAIAPTFKEYSKTPVWSLFKSRIFWLLILMITATISQVLIEKSISHTDIIILASLIPLMMDTAGNAGGQSGATIIRALSTNDIKIKDYWKVLWKETIVATLIGIILFVANYVRMIFLGKSIQISFITSLAVFITIVFAKLLGASLPILAKKVKLDPAVVAAPLITTIVDLLAILILFNVYKTLAF